VQDEYRQQLVKNANLSAPLLNGWTLYSHQKKAILQGLLMRRMTIALDMGMGKTLIGCVWAKAFRETFGKDQLKVFVICPVSLTKEWKRTAEEATGLQVEEDKAAEDSMDLKICSWAKVPKDVSSTVAKFAVICDEAHSMQSMEAVRTKQVLQLVRSNR
jgi:superfamily II DNA or RNA helicase